MAQGARHWQERRAQDAGVAGVAAAAHAKAVATLKTDDYRPVIDGRHIPHGPLAPEAMAMKPSVPMIIQNCDSEATFYLRNEPRNTAVTAGQVKARIKAQYSLEDAKARAIMDGYLRDRENRTPWNILAQFASDVVFRGRQLLVAEGVGGGGEANSAIRLQRCLEANG